MSRMVKDLRAPDRQELARLIAEAKDRPPMTPLQIQQQRISFAFGCLPETSKASKELVAKVDFATHGDLEAMSECIIDLLKRINDMIPGLHFDGKTPDWYVTASRLAAFQVKA